MNGRPYLDVAVSIIVDTSGRFLLQQRDNIPGILHPGMVGFFGGHREGNETFLECVAREIHEEIGYFVAPERFKYLTNYRSVETDAEKRSIHEEIFVAQGIPSDSLVVTEGTLLIAEKNELHSLAQRLVPSARFGMSVFFNSQLP
jgi:8-oxo-dGTP pyrophosphatase MutT (NUDIX family)